ncbi:DUF2550 domain-containing protein [Pseudonocardia sp. N23]|uniref:DUF2550 domain-containing protein n=1 Tax=Pseudonocardia sp. N23 TaxID=1987376 RepID=UPI000BFE2D46|nr:DUF2550 domain-containing protein [Pseudonocardia sp. N23]GAY12405.1 putative secreted/membrane protein [Pseudonocardia sp. N23]
MGTVAIVVGIVLLCACLLLGWFAVRRVRLMRGGGVDLCLRRRPAAFDGRDDVAGWHFGVGRYHGDEFAWHRLTSVRLGPTLRMDRADLQIVDRRPPRAVETYAIPTATSVLRLRTHGEDLELAMAPGVLTGFLAWLEAAPPGRTTGYRQAS